MSGHRVARVKTTATAWQLIERLERWGRRYEQPLRFMVVLPRPEEVEVWPAPGSPLLSRDREAVQEIIQEFKEEVTGE